MMPQVDIPQKVRIAYILPADVRGGVEEHVLSLVKCVDKSRFELFIVAPPRLADSLAADILPGEAEIIRLRIQKFGDIEGMRKFYQFLRSRAIHIVNTHMFIATFFYAPVARAAGVPVVFETTHLMEKWRLEKGFLRRNSFHLDRLFYLLLDKVLAVSHACKNDLMRMKRVPDEKIVVVQNGRDIRDFDPNNSFDRIQLRITHGYGESEQVFGVFARLNHQKGHKYLFEALRILKDRGRSPKFFVVGEGDLRDELVQQVNNLGLADQVNFAGFQRNIPALLDMVDVMVLPSLFEGLPLCTIEALAMERPVIATSVDGTPEVVQNHENGLLVPPRDALALAGAIEFAMDNRDTMSSLGKQGREFVVERFSLSRQVHETEEFYIDLCRRKRILGN